MSSNEIEQSLLSIGESLNQRMTLIEQFEYIYNHPRRNEIILFYLSALIYPRFPIKELDYLKEGKYTIV